MGTHVGHPCWPLNLMSAGWLLCWALHGGCPTKRLSPLTGLALQAVCAQGLPGGSLGTWLTSCAMSATSLKVRCCATALDGRMP